MLALLSSPVRRWVLTALLVPAVAMVLRKIAQYLQHRNEGEPTKSSRGLMKMSSGLRRLTGKKSENDAEPDGTETRRSA